MNGLRIVLISLSIASWTTPVNAEALFIASESDGNVILTGSGTFDLTQLSIRTTGTTTASGFSGTPPLATVGPAGARVANYVGISLRAPDSIGSLDSFAPADGGSGDFFGASFYFRPNDEPTIAVPENYVSGSPLSGSSFHAGQTLADLGIGLGTHVWTWGRGDFTDSLTLRVVPEPASLMIGALALLTVAGTRRQRS